MYNNILQSRFYKISI